ncbi:hypothetical protein FA13DRAFT_1713561 [Coprinellus micaceus]|uniref:Uncharacterized protein n=1 Tax=Coprinellus micaceus TaxID=71717 RepID=A0A4Y7SVL2_COPMI|nr:hypothetical protein FA13DRAFT_1713561 [Coprinellus micaceus]
MTRQFRLGSARHDWRPSNNPDTRHFFRHTSRYRPVQLVDAASLNPKVIPPPPIVARLSDRSTRYFVVWISLQTQSRSQAHAPTIALGVPSPDYEHVRSLNPPQKNAPFGVWPRSTAVTSDYEPRTLRPPSSSEPRTIAWDVPSPDYEHVRSLNPRERTRRSGSGHGTEGCGSARVRLRARSLNTKLSTRSLNPTPNRERRPRLRSLTPRQLWRIHVAQTTNLEPRPDDRVGCTQPGLRACPQSEPPAKERAVRGLATLSTRSLNPTPNRERRPHLRLRTSNPAPILVATNISVGVCSLNTKIVYIDLFNFPGHNGVVSPEVAKLSLIG